MTDGLISCFQTYANQIYVNANQIYMKKELKMINWNNVINNFTNETIEFVNGDLSLRDFVKSTSSDPNACAAVRTIEKVHRTAKGRKLARRALQRRGIYA